MEPLVCAECGQAARVFVLAISTRQVELDQYLCAAHSDPLVKRMWEECESIHDIRGSVNGDVLCDIRSIVADLNTYQSWFWLREVYGPRQMSMPVGSNEANALTVMLRKEPLSRPYTHHAMAAIIHSMGGHATKGVIDVLDRSTATSCLHAKLVIQHKDNELRVDMRPSDMLMLAVILDIPFFINSSILEEGR